MNITSTYWARRPYRDIFDVGPFPSREDAIDEAANLMQLAPGTEFEIGRMVPFVPEAPQAIPALSAQAQSKCPENPGASKWVKGLYSDSTWDTIARREELQQALDLVVLGWLTKHGLLPVFGTVKDVEICTAK